MTYRTTSRADEDISDLFVYGALIFGMVQAEAYEAGLFRTFELIAHNPPRHENVANCDRPSAFTRTVRT